MLHFSDVSSIAAEPVPSSFLQAFPLDVQVKLKDAALCTLTQSRGQVSVHKVAGRSRPSLLPYLAPEVLLGHRPRRSADVYAFGILMWELFTGGVRDRIEGNSREVACGSPLFRWV